MSRGLGDVYKRQQYCNENNIAISVGIDAQVDQAYQNKVVLTVAESSAASEHHLE